MNIKKQCFVFRLSYKTDLFFLYASRIRRFILFLSTALLNNRLGTLINIFTGTLAGGTSSIFILKGNDCMVFPLLYRSSMYTLPDRRSAFVKVCINF